MPAPGLPITSCPNGMALFRRALRGSDYRRSRSQLNTAFGIAALPTKAQGPEGDALRIKVIEVVYLFWALRERQSLETTWDGLRYGTS